MSSQQSRAIIRSHHRLHKQHAAALAKGDTIAADEIQKAIKANGGLKLYQAASKQGQSKDRGGDSSILLVEWLRDANVLLPRGEIGDPISPYRLLEVGALSTKNEISKFPRLIDVTRIDLNSQGPGIEQQDFMERPLPASANETFDIISLSLVLNYVPEPVGRGEMLKRITQFLRPLTVRHGDSSPVLPALFLVLPLPCVENSRYLDDDLLLRILYSLGFTLNKRKSTSKLCYYLFTMTREDNRTTFKKQKIRDGASMNNFCIVVE